MNRVSCNEFVTRTFDTVQAHHLLHNVEAVKMIN